MNREWNELIDRLLSGKLTLDSPEVVAACEDHAFVDALDNVYATSAALDESTILRVLEQGSPESQEVPAPLPVREPVPVRAVDDGRLRLLRWALPVLVAFAATLVLLMNLPSGEESSNPIGQTTLGATRFEMAEPQFREDGSLVLRWASDVPGGSYDVSLTDAQGVTLESGPLGDVNHYRFSAKELQKLAGQVLCTATQTLPGGGRVQTAHGMTEL